MDWWPDALCTQVGTALFYPDPEASPHAAGQSYAIARRVCRRCPVTGPCLAYAMALEEGEDHHGRFGLWGGRSPWQRAALARSGITG